MGKGLLSLRGRVRFEILDAEGRLLHRHEGSNVVVLAGKTLAAQLIADEAVGKPSHFGFGSNALAIDEGQTTLGTEFSFIGYARPAFTQSRSANVITYSTSGSGWQNNSGGTLNLREIGLFNAATAGTMFARFLTTAYTLGSNTFLRIAWALTVG
jgi:hypothetical protein